MKGGSIMFLTYWYPNKNNKSFGIFVKRHAHALMLKRSVILLSLHVAKGHTLFKKRVEVFTDEAGLATHQIYLESRFNKLLYVLLPLHFLILKRYLKNNLNPETKISAIHSNIIFPCSIVAYWLCKKFDLKLVITEHWTKVDKFFGRSLYGFLGKLAYNKAQAITCVSQQLADTVKKHTSNPAVYLVPNVIDTNEFYYDPLVTKAPILTFVAVAHWAQHKNPFYFLDALDELRTEKRLPDFRVVIIGNGEQLQKIKGKGYHFEIDFKYTLTANEICRELNAAHIFLHGSDFETFSVIIAEALMCGLPSVVSPVGIAPEVINATNGFVTNNTVTDWKEKIFACSRITYNNRQIAGQLKNKYDLATVGDLFSHVYEKVQ